MKAGWKTISFEKSYRKVKSTTKIKKKDFKESGLYPIVSQEQNLINGYWNNAKDIFNHENPIIVFGDHTKVIKFIDFDFVLGADGVKILYPVDDILPKYYYYYLMNLKIKDLGYARHFRLLKSKPIRYPLSKEEQKRIVSILDNAFAAIDKVIANTEKNLQNTREIFDSYLNEIFSNPGEDWKKCKFGKICNFVRGPFGGCLKKSIFVPDGYAVFEQRNAIYNQFEDIRYFINEDKFIEMKRFEVFPGDLIMSCSGTIGKVAIAPEHIKKGIINQALLKLTPNSSLLVSFLKFWMESENFKYQISKHTKGAAIKNIASVKVLKELDLKLPSIDIQREIISKIESSLSKTKLLESNYQQKLDNLKELKQSILQKAFEGEL